MEMIFRQTLHALKMINQSLDDSLITSKELQEEEKNIKDFIKLKEDMRILLEKIQVKENLKNRIWVNERLIDLHLRFCDIIWHVDQLHELIDKIIKMYPD
jgi:hypothetical protein